MPPNRIGLAPVVSVIILVFIVLVAGGGTYAWIGSIVAEEQEQAVTALNTALAVKDAQCELRTVRLGLSNTGNVELPRSDAGVFLFDVGSGNVVGSQADVDISGVLSPGSFSWKEVTFPAGTVIAPGDTHRVEVDAGEGATATATCNGGTWWWQRRNDNLDADGNGNTVSLGTVTVGTDGWYKVNYGATWHSTGANGRHYMKNWLRKNGSFTVIPSENRCYIRNTGNGDSCSNSGTVLVQANASDTIELIGTKHSGTSGETLAVEDHYLYAHRVGNPVAQVWDTTGGQDYNETTITVNMDSSTHVDSPFTFLSGSDAVEVGEDGLYRVYYSINNDDISQGDRQVVHSWIRLNGGPLPSEHPVDAYSYLRNTGSYNHQTGVAILDLSATDDLQIRQRKEYNQSFGESETLPDMNWLLVEQLPADDVLHVVESGGGQRISSGSTDSITFDTTLKAGERFAHTAGSSQVTIQEGGWYEVGYVFSWDDDDTNSRHVITGWLRKNGDTTIRPSGQRDYSRGCCSGRISTITTNTLHKFNGGDTLELRVNARGGYADVVANGTYITITPLAP